MTTEDAVRQAKNPQEAILALARGLDRVEQLLLHQAESTDDWFSHPWDSDVAHAKAHHELERRTVVESEDHEGGCASVEIPPVSEEKRAARREFEQQFLKLSEHYDEDVDWTEAYAKGGPMWLYLSDRDFVMSLPPQLRATMVADVEQESPTDAHEMGRDVLKWAGEEGPGHVAMDVGSVPAR